MASSEQIVQQYWQAAHRRDWAGFAALLDENVVYEVPQTRERIRGRDHYLDFNITFPGEWQLRVDSVIGNAQQAVSRITFFVDGTSCEGISFFTLQHGRITHILDYWPEPYDPPYRHTAHIERY